MKKTFFLLLALSCLSIGSRAVATAADAEAVALTLFPKAVSFGSSSSLTESNQAMSWDGGGTFSNWYITFNVMVDGGSGPTLTTAGTSSTASGLAVWAGSDNDNFILKFNNGNSTFADSGALTFSASSESKDTLAFAYFNGTAYIGNQTTGKYISYDLSSVSITTSMTSATSRAYSNGKKTPISSTYISSLDSFATVDMEKLMTTGAAVGTMKESPYYIYTSGDTEVWSDSADYTLEGATVAAASSLSSYYKYYSSTEDAVANKGKTLILNLGDAANGEVCDLGGTDFSNGVITIVNGSGELTDYPADDSSAAPKTYSYGVLELADNANIRLGASNGSAGSVESWSSTGALKLGNGAKLALDGRKFMVSGLPYASLGAEAEISVAANSILSFGPAIDDADWADADNVTISGANGSTAYIRNETNNTVKVGTESAKDAEFVNAVVAVYGSTSKQIVAKLGNAAIINRSTGIDVVVNGETANGYTTAVTQVSTGDNTRSGNVILLNRGEKTQEMDSIYIAKERTVTVKSGEDTKSESAVIKLNAYDSSKTYDVYGKYGELPGLIVTGDGAALDADLVLGTGNTDEVVFFQNAAALDMVNNDVTLQAGIMMYGYHTWDTETDVLLFTNVDSLTLGSNVYNERYFDEQAQIAACNYFSSSYEDKNGLMASVDGLTKDADGNLTGWFMEYRDNGAGEGTGDVYMVYRTVAAIPEPTTATLSLLALAGLAARRRRK